MDISKLDLNVLDGFNPSFEKDEKEGQPFIIPTVATIDDFATPKEEEKDEEGNPVDKPELDPDEPKGLDGDGSNRGEPGAEGFKEPEVEVSANKVMADWLATNSLLEFKEEEFEDSEDFIKTKFQESIETKVKEEIEAYKAAIPEPLKELFQNYEDGVPIHELLQTEARLSEFSSIKVEEMKEDANLQKEVITQHLIMNGYDEDEAETKVKKYEENLMLEEESLTALKKLVKAETKYKEQLISESKIAAENFRKEQESKLKQYEDSVKSLKEIVPGLPISEKEQKEILNLTTKIVGKDKSGRPINGLKKLELEDPNFLAKVAYFAGVLKFDIEPFKKLATTEATKKVKTVANAQPNEVKGFTKADINALKKAVDRQRKARMF